MSLGGDGGTEDAFLDMVVEYKEDGDVVDGDNKSLKARRD